MTSRAHNQPSLDLAVYDPLVTGSFKRFQRSALQNASPAAGQQELIKLESSYPVADGSTVLGFDLGPTHATGAKSSDFLKDAALRILHRT